MSGWAGTGSRTLRGDSARGQYAGRDARNGKLPLQLPAHDRPPLLHRRLSQRPSTPPSWLAPTTAAGSTSTAPPSTPPPAASRSTPAGSAASRSSTWSTRATASRTSSRHPSRATGVAGAIDWPRRFDHMQQHTGQHLLSAVIAERFGHATVSVHFGARERHARSRHGRLRPRRGRRGRGARQRGRHREPAGGGVLRGGGGGRGAPQGLATARAPSGSSRSTVSTGAPAAAPTSAPPARSARLPSGRSSG